MLKNSRDSVSPGNPQLFLPAEVLKDVRRELRGRVDPEKIERLIEALSGAAEQTILVGQKETNKAIVSELNEVERAARSLRNALEALSEDSRLSLGALVLERQAEGLHQALNPLTFPVTGNYVSALCTVATDIEDTTAATVALFKPAKSDKLSTENAKRLAWLVADSYQRVTGLAPPKSEWFYEVVRTIATHLALKVSKVTVHAQVDEVAQALLIRKDKRAGRRQPHPK